MCPIYELNCPTCDKLSEVITKWDEFESTVYTCLICETELQKCLSAGNFILNGGGWFSFTNGKKNPGVK